MWNTGSPRAVFDGIQLRQYPVYLSFKHAFLTTSLAGPATEERPREPLLTINNLPEERDPVGPGVGGLGPFNSASGLYLGTCPC